MPKRNPGQGFKVVTALFVILILSLASVGLFQAGRSKGQAEGEYSANSDTYARDAQENIEQRCILLDPLRMAECIREIVDNHNESETAQRDIVAQTDMALWALAMAVLTAVTAAVTGIGVWYVRKTLTQANDTNKAAVAASTAANDANIIARQEQRPWVTVRWQVPCVFSVPDNGSTCEINWLYDFENLGKSPAFRIRYEWAVYRLDTQYVGAGMIGVRDILSKAKRNLMRMSMVPVLFAMEKTQNFSPANDRLTMEGHDKGSFFLCCCVTYALDASNRYFGIEARAYQIEATENPTENHTHDILRVGGYEIIDTWEIPMPKSKD